MTGKKLKSTCERHQNLIIPPLREVFEVTFHYF